MAGFWGSASQGFTRGVGLGVENARYQEEMDLKRAEHEARMREQALRERRIRGELDDADRVRAAVRNLEAMDRVGVPTGVVRGLSGPSQEMVFRGDAGYGEGAAAVNEMATDFGREMRRYGQDAGLYDDRIGQRQATGLDRAKGMRSLAYAKGDVREIVAADKIVSDKEEDQIIANAKFEPEDIKFINDNTHSFSVSKPDKFGFVDISIVKPDGDAVFKRLSAAQQKTLAGARALLDVNPVRALEMFKSVDKDVAEAVAKEMGMTLDVARFGNDVAAKRVNAQQEIARTGIAQAGLAEARSRLSNSQYVLIPGPDGMLKPAIQGTVFNPVGQKLEVVTVPLEQSGVVPLSALDPKRLSEMAEPLIGKPTGRTVNGKPEVYTPETAMAAVRQQIIANYLQQPGTGGPDPNVVKAMKEGRLTPAPKEAPREAPAQEVPQPPQPQPEPRSGLRSGLDWYRDWVARGRPPLERPLLDIQPPR
jgi:hypothetical protein